jgi:DNA-binding protein H-NS
VIKSRDFIDAGKSKIAARRIVRELDNSVLSAIIDNLVSAQRSEQAKLQARAAQEKAASIKKVKALMGELNVTIADINKPLKKGIRVKRDRRKAVKALPKYEIRVGKETRTWTGRGRMPLVFKEFVEKGGSLEQCLIK